VSHRADLDRVRRRVEHGNLRLELIAPGFEPIIDQRREDPQHVLAKPAEPLQTKDHGAGGGVNLQDAPSAAGDEDEEVLAIELDAAAPQGLGRRSDLDDQLGTGGDGDVHASELGGLCGDVGQLSGCGLGR
jgi:hypothetical protein